MNKDTIRLKLIELATAELASAREAYDEHLEASKPEGEGEVTDIDDQARAWSQADLAASFEAPLRAAEEKIAALEAIDFGPKTRVEPGAVVTVDGRHFVIAITADPFTCDGLELTGLSPAVPLYQAIEGLAKAETGEFRRRQVTVENVA